jgi:translation initiation factor IF-3
MDGVALGIMSNREAQQRAYDEGLDLVEIAANANPPVCQIMDYGKFKYEKCKAQKDQQKKNKSSEMKEVQVSPVIGDHDLDTKTKHLIAFLKEGRQVQVTCVFSRRQIMFKDHGYTVLKKMTDAVVGIGVPEKAPQFNEKRLQIRFRPLNKEV